MTIAAFQQKWHTGNETYVANLDKTLCGATSELHCRLNRFSTAEPSDFRFSQETCYRNRKFWLFFFFLALSCHAGLAYAALKLAFPLIPRFCPVFILARCCLAPRTCFAFSCANPASSVRAGRLEDCSDGGEGGQTKTQLTAVVTSDEQSGRGDRASVEKKSLPAHEHVHWNTRILLFSSLS